VGGGPGGGPAALTVPRWLVCFAVAGTFACSETTAPGFSLPPPADLGDGWLVATPASVELDPGALVALAERVEREELGHVHALLVVRHGALVFERYFHEYDASAPHTLQSVTKSVTSALMGIAMDRGQISSLDLTLGELFPDYDDILGPDSVKAGIRIRDLLSMQSGMAWDESSYPFSDDRNDAGRLSRSTDWIRTALEQPIDAVPGTTWTYNSGASILLSGILLRLTGLDAADYAVEHLFGPMGFSDFLWFRNPADGLPHTGGGLRLFPRDLARFGQLYLDGGVWNGTRLISAEWVEKSRTLRATVGESHRPRAVAQRRALRLGLRRTARIRLRRPGAGGRDQRLECRRLQPGTPALRCPGERGSPSLSNAPSGYSPRSASSGLARMTRRAGSQMAAAATEASVTATPA
jgi:CubicO group peptidase (beta-lactamase class C family)